MGPSKCCHETHYLATLKKNFLNLKNKTRNPSTHKGSDFKIHEISMKHSSSLANVTDYIQKPLTIHKANLKQTNKPCPKQVLILTILCSIKLQLLRTNAKHLYDKERWQFMSFAIVLTSILTLRYYRFESLTISIQKLI